MKALLLIFSTLLVLLVAGLWVGSGSYPEHWKTEDRISAQEDSNEQRKDDIERIKSDLEDVATGDSAIEERARSELGMTKENESFFEIILRPESNKQPLLQDKVKGRDMGDDDLKSAPTIGVNPLLQPKTTLGSESKLEPEPEPNSNPESKPKRTKVINDINEDENNKIDSEIEKSINNG